MAARFGITCLLRLRAPLEATTGLSPDHAPGEISFHILPPPVGEILFYILAPPVGEISFDILPPPSGKYLFIYWPPRRGNIFYILAPSVGEISFHIVAAPLSKEFTLFMPLLGGAYFGGIFCIKAKFQKMKLCICGHADWCGDSSNMLHFPRTSCFVALKMLC